MAKTNLCCYVNYVSSLAVDLRKMIQGLLIKCQTRESDSKIPHYGHVSFPRIMGTETEEQTKVYLL